jgi:hypothetical protein
MIFQERQMAQDTTMTLEQIQTVVDRFTQQSVRVHDGHAYAAGYLGSMVARLLRQMPIEEQLLEVDLLLNASIWVE